MLLMNISQSVSKHCSNNWKSHQWLYTLARSHPQCQTNKQQTTTSSEEDLFKRHYHIGTIGRKYGLKAHCGIILI